MERGRSGSHGAVACANRNADGIRQRARCGRGADDRRDLYVQEAEAGNRTAICTAALRCAVPAHGQDRYRRFLPGQRKRSEEHTSELQSLMRSTYDVFCLKKKIHNTYITKKNQ